MTSSPTWFERLIREAALAPRRPPLQAELRDREIIDAMSAAERLERGFQLGELCGPQSEATLRQKIRGKLFLL